MTWKKWLSISILGIILTAVFTWPFAAKISTFYEDLGDYSLNGSMFAYNEYSIRTGRILNRDEYFNGYQFYPQPYTIAYSDPRLVESLIYSPLFWLTKNLPLSVNLVTFSAFVLSFIFSFFAVNYFVRNPLASIIGAIVYTFNPLSFSRMPVHVELLSKYLLPLVFLFGYKFFKEPNRKNALLFFTTFTLNAFTAIYFQIFTFLLLPFFAIPFLISRAINKDSDYFVNLFKNCLLFLPFLPIFIYFDTPYLEFSQKENIVRTLDVSAFFSARFIDFVSPSKDSILYGQFVQNIEKYRAPKDLSGIFNYTEHSLSLNIIPTILFLLFALNIYIRRKQGKQLHDEKITFAPFIVLLLVSFILMLGPFFQGWNTPVGSLKLPYYYLYESTPLLKAIRVPTRFEFVFYVPFALFVAFGAKLIFQKFKNELILGCIFAAILLGFFFENYNKTSYDTTPLILKKPDEIRSSGFSLNFLEGKNTIHIPVYALDMVWESRYLNWATQTHEKLANGNTGLITNDQLVFLNKAKEKLDEDTIKMLKAVNINYLIIHKNLLDPAFKIDFDYIKNGVIYNNYDTQIVDLSKVNAKINFCDFNKDLEVNATKATLQQSAQTIDVLIVKNKSDCYFPSIYKDKYKETSFYVNNLLGSTSKQTIDYKLPILVFPYQQLILSEIGGDIKIQKP